MRLFSLWKRGVAHARGVLMHVKPDRFFIAVQTAVLLSACVQADDQAPGGRSISPGSTSEFAVDLSIGDSGEAAGLLSQILAFAEDGLSSLIPGNAPSGCSIRPAHS